MPDLQQYIGQTRFVERQAAWGLGHERRDIVRRRPALAAIVQHNGHDGRQEPAGHELLTTDQPLIQQPHIGHETYGHVAIHRRLKFDEQVNVEPAILPPDTPQDIIFPLT